MRLEAVPAQFFGRWAAYLGHLGSIDPATTAVAAGSLLILVAWPRINRTIPAPLMAVLAATAVVRLMHLPVETIGSRFGAINMAIPRPALPHVTEAMIVSLVAPAFTIAMLAAIESLLSAVVADGMIGSRHRSNMLVAQGTANVIAPLFGGIPATGAIARTATNIKHGGRTPVAGLVHSATLLVITLFFGRWAALIPLACLGAILTIVAYHMSEWRTVLSELRGDRSDAAVLVTTLVLTVVVDLTVAIGVGMVLASILFMRRMADTTSIAAISGSLREAYLEQGEAAAVERHARVPRDVEVYDINGPFFFGAAEKFRDALSQVSKRPRALILDMENVPVIDSTGLRALTAVVEQCRKQGTWVLLADLTAETRERILDASLAKSFGPGELELTFDEATSATLRIPSYGNSGGFRADRPSSLPCGYGCGSHPRIVMSDLLSSNNPTSRRGFLRGSAVIAIGLPSAAGILSGCAEGKASGATKEQGPSDHPTTPAAAAPPPSARARADAMDAMHEKGVKAFPAKTRGKGNQLLRPRVQGGLKVYDLTCREVDWEVEPGRTVKAWAYNGQVPGPQIRVRQGDRVRVNVRNELPQSTAVHFHGLELPNDQDGVPFITQPPIKSGGAFTYEFVVPNAGSHMYHSHHNAAYQVGMGLLGAFIVEPADTRNEPKADVDHVMILNDTMHGYTLNGKAFPATEPIVAKLGQTVRIRFMNEGMMIHPMHLHGMHMTVIAKDGWDQPAPWKCDTLNVAPGERWDVLVKANNPGTWAFHCHILPHAESEHGMLGMVTALVVQPAGA